MSVIMHSKAIILFVANAKDLALKIFALAAVATDAAGKKDGDAVKMNLNGIKAACDECHIKIRDKKEAGSYF